MKQLEELKGQVAAWQRLKEAGEREGDQDLMKLASAWIVHYEARIEALSRAIRRCEERAGGFSDGGGI